MEFEVVSPELALVDPELAARARALLPDPPPPQSRPKAVVLAAPSPPPRRGRLGVPLIVASLMLNVVLLGRVFETRDPTPARLTEATEIRATEAPPVRRSGVAAATAVRSKGALVRVGDAEIAPKASRTVLTWPRAMSASRYDIVVWRGHRRVLDVWTTQPRVDLTTLSCADRRKLQPKLRYLWFVYPLQRGGGRSRFGALRAWGSIELPHAIGCGPR